MLKFLQISLAALTITVFMLYKLPFYDCKQQNTIHIFESCCVDAEVKQVKSCCSESPSKRVAAEINNLCCDEIKINFNDTFCSNFEHHTPVKTHIFSSIDFTFQNRIDTIKSINLGRHQRAPPNPVAHPKTEPLFIIHSSLLC